MDATKSTMPDRQARPSIVKDECKLLQKVIIWLPKSTFCLKFF